MTIIDKIYDAVVDDAVYADLPRALAEAVHARSGLILIYDDMLRVVDYAAHYYSEELTSKYMLGRFEVFDVWIQQARVRSLGRAHLLEEAMDAATFTGTVIYNELFKVCGDDTARCMAALMRRKSGYISFAVHRALGDRGFEPADAAALDRLLPHLRRLVEMRDLLSERADQAALARAGLDAVAAALFVTDPAGRVALSNGPAETLVRASAGLTVRGGRLIAADPRANDQLSAAIRGAALRRDRHGDVVTIPRAAPLGPLRALVAPLPTRSDCALVLVEDVDREATGSRVRRLPGLTLAETEVAGLLARGRSLDEIAARRGVSRETARTQAKAVYDKLGVDGQVRLMRVFRGVLG